MTGTVHVHKVDVDLNACGIGEVKVDGQTVLCTGVTLDANAQEMPRVEVRLLADFHSEVEGEVMFTTDGYECAECGHRILRPATG